MSLSPAAAAPGEPAIESPPGLPPRFTLLRRLGQGTSGTVYAAHEQGRELLVALKLLPLTRLPADVVATTTGTVAGAGVLNHLHSRFAAEAAAAQRLHHPDIVATLGAGSAGHQAWLAMELVPGTSLARYARTPRLLPEPLVLEIVERLARALAHAHGLGVVHRDVKPANVLVHLPQRLVKLADFGLARASDAEATRTGLVLGSPAYMAPELLAGAVPDARSDLYALGVTLFELLCGRLPHDAASMGALLRQVAAEPAPDLRSLRPDMPAALATLLDELLSKRPAQRPASGDAVAAPLQAVRN